MPIKPWSTLAKVVFKRTYSRKIIEQNTERLESYAEAIERAIQGNVRGHNVPPEEVERLRYYLLNRKAGPAGRGLWFSGTEAHGKMGGVALCNCWGLTASEWENFIIAQDLLMLGGGVGMTVEHKYTSKLPKVKRGVQITHQATKDADYIVPDSRQGWCELSRRVLEAFFVTGKGFSYSTVCVRNAGEPIAGFGGSASGPLPLIGFVSKVSALLASREGKHVRPIDAADLLCCVGEMVVAGNVRRSALLIQGDCWDKEFLRAKRWDLGQIPTQRAMANWSVNCDDVEDLHPAYWDTYKAGEPFGIVNVKNMRTYGRMGELKKDTAVITNPCAEIALEEHEPCNLFDVDLPNLDSEEEFREAAVLGFRWCRRVAAERYHQPLSDAVIKRNQRVGVSITGCLQSPLFTPDVLDRVYQAIQDENVRYSKELGLPQSIRTTTIKPSGTKSKVTDVDGEGIHPAYSRYAIQRVRFSASDPLLPRLADAGHHMEPVVRFDGTLDHGTMVVDFYKQAPDNLPCADEGFDTWAQLDALLLAQKHWSDNSVSVTVYYKREEIPLVKAWLTENLKNLKTISFLCYSDHGFKQAPKEPVSKEEYERQVARLKPVELDDLKDEQEVLDGLECAGGACPIR